MENTDPSANGLCLDTVKALHQTIVSLRTALEQSKTEILQLKQRAWPAESVQNCLSTLTIENHVLKTHLLNKQGPCCLGKEVLKNSVKDVGIETTFHTSSLEKRHVNKVAETKDIKTILKTDNNTFIEKIEATKASEIEKGVHITGLLKDTIERARTKYSDSENKNSLKPSKKNPKPSPERKIKINVVPEIAVLSSNIDEISEPAEKVNSSFERVPAGQETTTLKEEEESAEQTHKSIQDIGELVQQTIKSNLQTQDLVEAVRTVEQIRDSVEQTEKSKAEKEVYEESINENIEIQSEEPDKSVRETEQFVKENISYIIENISPQKISASLENLIFVKSPSKTKNKNLTISKTISFSNISDLKKTVTFRDKNSNLILIEAENSDTIMTSKTSAKPTNSQNAKIIEPRSRSASPHSSSPLPKSVSHPSVTSAEVISSPRSSTQNKEVELPERNSIPVSVQSTSEIEETNDLKSQMKEAEDDSLNIFDDSASSPSTVKERSVKLSMSDYTNNYKQHESMQNISPQSELGQNEEVDDIELIFTTDETKESDFKGELVPIESNESMHHLQCPGNDTDQNLSFEISDRELDDDVFNEGGDSSKCYECNSQMYNSKSDNSINQEERSLKSCYSCQDSSFENKSFDKEESFDQFEEKVRIIETDISKCGILDVDFTINRRNTCPNPLPYRPIIHREAIGKGLNIRKGRPILGHSTTSRRDSGAQTDISALPNSFWRSESSLAHKVKVGENFTTLPSKLPLPCSRIKLSEKTVEARRVLLSDIGFTSMVPELSRSADHLGPETSQTPAAVHYGQFLKTPDLYSPGLTPQRFNWATTVSPLEMSRSQSRYSSIYPLSPPAPSRRCSAPVSPSRRPCLKQTSKVKFANGSLPELRVDWTSTGDSGDSTDSLVEEAENFLRRSIDCLTSRGDYHRVKGNRRASAPEPTRDSIPLDWQPFLPRTPHDLRHEHWVKVIVPGEGKVRGGRVRYIGPVTGQTEQYVGVQLSTPDGHSDGVFHNRRYFSCEPHHAVFVPFKKVIMGWKP